MSAIKSGAGESCQPSNNRLTTRSSHITDLFLDETRSISQYMKYLLQNGTEHLIIALCASIRHDTSWQNAVRAVSGDDILVEVKSDLTLTSGRDRTSSETWGGGKQVSALIATLGW